MMAVAGAVALIFSILLCIFVIPVSKKKHLNGFFLMLHNIFNFRKLLIEGVYKFLYAFCTLSSVLVGIVTTFWWDKIPHYGYKGVTYTYEWRGYFGILLLIFGPILVRIVFEGIMMFIIAVKNIIEINSKGNTPSEKKNFFDRLH